MCEIKRITLYECPICHKRYRRKGYYLNRHLKQCKAIAWIPKVEVRIVMKSINEEKLSEAIDLLCSGKFVAHADPIERIKIEAKKDLSKKSMPCFEDYKEDYLTGKHKLIEVPQSELNHIYNIMV